MGAGIAVFFFLTVRRFVREELAGVAALLWLVLPNHTSLEVWASAANITLACCCSSPVATHCPVIRSAGRGSSRPPCCFAASALCYEATLPVAALAAFALPWFVARRIRWDAVVAVGVTTGLAALWIVTHWHPAKSVSHHVADLSQMLGTHLGWGIAPDGVVADLLHARRSRGHRRRSGRVVLPSFARRRGSGADGRGRRDRRRRGHAPVRVLPLRAARRR